MSDSDKKPLDFEEVVQPEEQDPSKEPRKGALLELIPITLIVIGLVMRNRGIDGGSAMLTIGGALASLMYLLLSWYMFKVERYKSGEVVLSIMVGLIFPIGILGLLFSYESWPYAIRLMNIALYGGALLFILCLTLFIFNLRDNRASVFYRNVLTRLLVFTALVVKLHPDLSMLG